MKILIASDFFHEWELIESDIDTAEEYILANLRGEKAPDVKILASQDSTIERPQADKVLFITEYMD